MCDSIKQTTEQLMNLVWFCQKVNIPYEVYFFTSEIGGSAWSTDRQLNKVKKFLLTNMVTPLWTNVI